MIHDRRFFYKYMTSETALKILRSRTLRYSSPVLFNDPFDVQTTIDYGFSLDEYDKAYREELYRFVQCAEEPTCVNSDSDFDELMLLRRLNRIRPIMPIEMLEEEAKTFFEKQALYVDEVRKSLNEWFQKLVRASKVFCLAEERDNLLMWAHYAKDHTGVVLEFECSEEWDHPLCAARKVKYVEKPPALAQLDEFIGWQTGQGPGLNYDNIFYDLILSKSLHWAYEKEWRVFIPPIDMENPIIPTDGNGEEILVQSVRLHPEELTAIYFGCRIAPSARKEIEECVGGDLGHVKRYSAIRNARDYRLDFVVQ